MSMDREAILKSMLGGVSPAPEEAQIKTIAAVMKAFSLKQLQKMEAAGVRLWPFTDSLPPEYKLSIPDLTDPAAYHHPSRTIRISSASMERPAFADFLRHEMAHAWDNVRTGKNPKSLRNLKGDPLFAEVERRMQDTAPFESQSAKKLPPAKKMSLTDMLDRYKKVLAGTQDKTKSFAHRATADKHNSTNVMEFYAEGYSVFHAYDQAGQSRMLWLAPELFGFLESEAKGEGQLSPSRDQLEKLLDDTEKNWRNY
jgi:hypothetical protein